MATWGQGCDAELPSRKARSLSRKRPGSERDVEKDEPKSKSEERKPFSYLRKNGGKQSYSKIGEEYKQPPLRKAPRDSSHGTSSKPSSEAPSSATDSDANAHASTATTATTTTTITKSPKSRSAKTSSKIIAGADPAKSAMFPYMVSGDEENSQPSPETRGADSVAEEASDSKHPKECLKSQQIKAEVTAATATAAATRTSSEPGRPEAESKSGSKPPRSVLLKKVTESQKKTASTAATSSSVRQERRDEIKEVRVEELHTTDQASATAPTTTTAATTTTATTAVDSTREEVVTVELKRQGLQKREAHAGDKHDDLRNANLKSHDNADQVDGPKDSREAASAATMMAPGQESSSSVQFKEATTASARRKRAQWNKSGDLAVVPKESVEEPTSATNHGDESIRSETSRSSAKVVRGILGDDIDPEDLVTLEMIPNDEGGGVTSMKRKDSLVRTIKVRDIIEAADNEDLVIRQSELRASNVTSPSSASAASDEEMVEFVVRHGREKNIFWLPASRITQDRKWQVTFVVAKTGQSPDGSKKQNTNG